MKRDFNLGYIRFVCKKCGSQYPSPAGSKNCDHTSAETGEPLPFLKDYGVE